MPTMTPSSGHDLSPRPLRVLFDIVATSGFVWRGLEEHVVILGRRLAATGHEPLMVLRADYPPDLLSRISAAGIRAVSAPGLISSGGNWAPLRRWAPPLWRMLREERIDLYHIQSTWEGNEVRAAVTARLAGVPAIVCSYQCLPYSWPESRRRPLGMWAMHRLLRVRGIAVSTGLRDLVQKCYAPPVGFLSVVFDGVEDLPAQPRGPAPPRSSGVTVGVVSFLTPEKGVDTFVAALAKLDRALPVRAVIVGDADGDELEQLKRQAHRLGVGDRVEFKGFVADASRLLHGFDLVVIPSRREGLPLVGAEACAAGRPIVATRAGGLPDLVQEGENGWLVPIDDPSALARAIESAVRDPHLRAHMGRASRRRFETHFHAEIMATNTMQVYQAAMSARRRRRSAWVSAPSEGRQRS